MHVFASMCFPRVSQSSCVIMCSCISGPQVLTRFEKNKTYILADFAFFGRAGFGLELRK